MISLGLVKEDPTLRPWFCRRSAITFFSILSNDSYPLAHFVQRVMPDLQHPFQRDYLVACEHRHVVEYSEGSIDQAQIVFVFRDIARLGNFSDHPPPSMEIIGHKRRVNFPIGCPPCLSSLHDYGCQRYDDSQRRNYNGYEVLRGLEPMHGNTILLQSAKRGRDLTSSRPLARLWPGTWQAPVCITRLRLGARQRPRGDETPGPTEVDAGRFRRPAGLSARELHTRPGLSPCP